MAHVYDNAGLDAKTTGNSGSPAASMAIIKHYTMAAHKRTVKHSQGKSGAQGDGGTVTHTEVPEQVELLAWEQPEKTNPARAKKFPQVENVRVM